MATTTKVVNHAPASTVQVHAASVSGSVTIASPVTSPDRVWVSTNPLVSIYPWYGTVVNVGASVSVSVLPGQSVFTHAESPTSLTVTIA